MTYQQIGEALGLATQTASKHGNKPHVQAAIRAHYEDLMAATRELAAEGFAVGMSALVDIARDREHPRRADAAKALVGMHTPTRHEVAVSSVTVQLAPTLAAELAMVEEEEG